MLCVLMASLENQMKTLCSDHVNVWYFECRGPVLRSSILLPILLVWGRIDYTHVIQLVVAGILPVFVLVE